jgi:hypothetical protein
VQVGRRAVSRCSARYEPVWSGPAPRRRRSRRPIERSGPSPRNHLSTYPAVIGPTESARAVPNDTTLAHSLPWQHNPSAMPASTRLGEQAHRTKSEQGKAREQQGHGAGAGEGQPAADRGGRSRRDRARDQLVVAARLVVVAPWWWSPPVVVVVSSTVVVVPCLVVVVALEVVVVPPVAVAEASCETLRLATTSVATASSQTALRVVTPSRTCPSVPTLYSLRGGPASRAADKANPASRSVSPGRQAWPGRCRRQRARSREHADAQDLQGRERGYQRIREEHRSSRTDTSSRDSRAASEATQQSTFPTTRASAPSRALQAEAREFGITDGVVLGRWRRVRRIHRGGPAR